MNKNPFDLIKQEIINDSMNQSFTERGILPLFSASCEARLLIVGQAPGRIAEETGLFWNDMSGDRLRDWLGISRDIFYNTDRIVHLPMDFYYPGRGKSGDLPPRPAFAPLWHPKLIREMPKLQTILLVGAHAQKYYLGNSREKTLTETVRNFEHYLPNYFPLVHPSPLNVGWQKRNPWFVNDVVPKLREIVSEALS